MTIRRLIGGVVVTLALAMLAWFAFPYLFEQRTRTVLIPPSKEVFQNPYLAAQRLLVSMGGSVQRVQAPYVVFNSEKMNVLLIPAGRASLSQDWMEQLRAWVRAGGHVVVAAEPYARPDHLLELWKVQRREVDSKVLAKIVQMNDKLVYEVQAQLPGRDNIYRLNLYSLLGTDLSLTSSEAKILSQDEAAVYMLQLDDGAGKVTVMSTMDFLTNFSIGQSDHADFLWSLVGPTLVPAQVTILDLPTLSLMDWLLHYAWTILLTLTMLIMVWLWSVLPRFGPVMPDPVPENRRLYDHVLASGRLLWNGGLIAPLAGYAQASAWRLVRRQVPFFFELSPAQQTELLQQRYGLSTRQIQDFLRPHTPLTQNEFIRWISLCRQIQQRG